MPNWLKCTVWEHRPTDTTLITRVQLVRWPPQPAPSAAPLSFLSIPVQPNQDHLQYLLQALSASATSAGGVGAAGLRPWLDAEKPDTCPRDGSRDGGETLVRCDDLSTSTRTVNTASCHYACESSGAGSMRPRMIAPVPLQSPMCLIPPPSFRVDDGPPTGRRKSIGPRPAATCGDECLCR